MILHNYNYEVIIVHRFYDTGDDSGRLYQWTDLFSKPDNYLMQGNKYSRHNCYESLLPIGKQRKYYFQQTNGNSEHYCWASAYRRIGTNS